MHDPEIDEIDEIEWAEESGGHSWAFITVGFLGGILLGGFLLWSNSLEKTAVAITVETAEVTDEVLNAQQSQALVTSELSQTLDLERENARLREELEREKLKRELAQIRGELSALKKPKSAARQTSPGRADVPTDLSKSASASAQGAGAKQLQGAQTLAYWNSMNAIFAQEAQMRAVPTGGLQASNASDYLQRRASAGQFAAQSLRGLDKADVDREVVQLVMEIANWYDQGVSNSSGASSLLGADRKTRQGSRGKQWKSSEKNHNEQLKGINAKGEQVRARMTKKYGMPFPPMQ